ncbi:MAG: hypothetical protein D6795_18565 [Deltaproteobacteria bacterium]|nr:MAG: hypothetical protein D6795_18565 [Deltaproteobacteria bacterium]
MKGKAKEMNASLTRSTPHGVSLALRGTLLALSLSILQAPASCPSGTFDTGPQYLDACLDFNSNCEGSSDPNCGKCQYRIRYRQENCSKRHPCDNLFMLWAAQTCEGDTMTGLLDQVLEANDDFATACITPQFPGETLPVTLGAPEREALLIPYLFQRLRDPADLGIWNGKNLLMGGCSAGASRYPIVAARYPDDAAWMGAEKNAACFSEGVISIAEQDRFIGEKLDSGASCPGRHQRIIAAYTRDTPLPGHRCQDSPQNQCPCDPLHTSIPYPGDCNEGDCVTFDSVVVQAGNTFLFNEGISSADFSIEAWKLMSEGSRWEDTNGRCQNDVVPKAPLQGLCELLDADPQRSCTFVEQPTSPHCAYYGQHINEVCVDWFRGL